MRARKRSFALDEEHTSIRNIEVLVGAAWRQCCPFLEAGNQWRGAVIKVRNPVGEGAWRSSVSELSQELSLFNLPWVFHFRAYLTSPVSD
jgi:hypothetical protein